MKKLMIMTVAAMALGLSALAATEPTFAYQGVLRDELGKPLVNTKTVTIDFKLYESPDGDTAVWGRRMTVAIDTNGLFNAELADANGSKTVKSDVTLADVIANAEAKQNVSLYVGLTVQDSTGEIRPRQKLLSVPMAAYAQDVRKAKNGFTVDGDLVVNGSIGSSGLDSVLSAKSLQVGGGGASSFSSPVDFAAGATIGGTDSSETNLVVNGAMEVKGNINLAAGCTVMLNGKYNALLPVGTITLWSGNPAALPPGWVICAPRWVNGKETAIKYTNPYDGQDYEVPDLRGRFVVGANYESDAAKIAKKADFSEYKMNATGGKEKHALSADELPSFTVNYWHLAEQNEVFSGSVLEKKNERTLGNNKSTYYQYKRAESVSCKNQAHENRPPFYALCYIIFIGDKEK